MMLNCNSTWNLSGLDQCTTGKIRSKLEPVNRESMVGFSKQGRAGPAILLTPLNPNPKIELHCCSAAPLRFDAPRDEIASNYSQILAVCIELSWWLTETPVSLKNIPPRNRYLWVCRGFHLEVLACVTILGWHLTCSLRYQLLLESCLFFLFLCYSADAFFCTGGSYRRNGCSSPSCPSRWPGTSSQFMGELWFE